MQKLSFWAAEKLAILGFTYMHADYRKNINRDTMEYSIRKKILNMLCDNRFYG